MFKEFLRAYSEHDKRKKLLHILQDPYKKQPSYYTGSFFKDGVGPVQLIMLTNYNDLHLKSVLGRWKWKENSVLRGMTI